MTQYIYSIYNKLVNAYNAPSFEILNVDQKKQAIARAVIMAKDEEREILKNCDLYFLGTFNDETGEITLQIKPDFVLAIGGILRE